MHRYTHIYPVQFMIIYISDWHPARSITDMIYVRDFDLLGGCVLSQYERHEINNHPLSSLENPGGCAVVSGVAWRSSRRREASLCTGNEFVLPRIQAGYEFIEWNVIQSELHYIIERVINKITLCLLIKSI